MCSLFSQNTVLMSQALEVSRSDQCAHTLSCPQSFIHPWLTSLKGMRACEGMALGKFWKSGWKVFILRHFNLVLFHFNLWLIIHISKIVDHFWQFGTIGGREYFRTPRIPPWRWAWALRHDFLLNSLLHVPCHPSAHMVFHACLQLCCVAEMRTDDFCKNIYE